jgi:hypothetical protein
MPGLNKFDPKLEYWTDAGGETTIAAKGPLTLDNANEKPMVICVQIYQNDDAGKLKLVAECNGAEHAFDEAFPTAAFDRWSCHGHPEAGAATIVDGQAVGTAILVTGTTNGGGFNTYTWTESFELVERATQAAC